jgi:hypothetical protein
MMLRERVWSSERGSWQYDTNEIVIYQFTTLDHPVDPEALTPNVGTGVYRTYDIPQSPRVIMTATEAAGRQGGILPIFVLRFHGISA